MTGYPDIAALPALADYGFTGGRDCLAGFAARVFAPGGPRFLRTAAGELAVVRNRDLQRMGAMPEIGSVPPAVLFGTAYGAGPETPGAALAGVIANQVFTANPPLHKPLRKALVARLGPKQTAEMEPCARAVVREILDGLDPAAPIDVVAVAERLTCGFWGAMLGMTAAEAVAMERHVRDLTPMFFLDTNLDDVRTFDAGATGYRALIEEAAARGIARGDNPFVAALAADLAAIDLADDPAVAGIVPVSVGAMLGGNLIDGFHTAALAAANTIHALASRPDAFARIAADPALVPGAIFEALRLEPPVLMLKRWVIADVMFDDMRLERGSVIAMLWGVGGYDPDVFADPVAFDAARSRQGSTTFGGGLHLCPGRYFAVMLVRVLLEAMLARGWRFGATDAAEWIPGHAMGQLRHFPLEIREAT